MTSDPPLLLELSSFGNEWEKYLDALYDIYINEIVKAELSYNGLPIQYQFRPMIDGKGYGFWHLISEGETEENRTPDLRRCERIRWIIWTLQEVGLNSDILWYENKRKANIHIVLWCKSHHYAVILAKRNGYYLLKTAYVIAPHREKIFEKEWKEYWRKS